VQKLKNLQDDTSSPSSPNMHSILVFIQNNSVANPTRYLQKLYFEGSFGMMHMLVQDQQKLTYTVKEK